MKKEIKIIIVIETEEANPESWIRDAVSELLSNSEYKVEAVTAEPINY